MAANPEFKLPDDPRERGILKQKVLAAAKKGLTIAQIVEELGLRPDPSSPWRSLDIRALREQDFEFAQQLRDAMHGRPEDTIYVRQRYGVNIKEDSLNRFLVEYAETKSRAKACHASGIRPSTLMRLIDPNSDDYHPDFAAAVSEEELYQLLAVRDDWMTRAAGGDAAAQRFVLDRRDPDFAQKKPEKEPMNVFSLEALSNAARSLPSLLERVGVEKAAEEGPGVPEEPPNELPEGPAGSSEDSN